MLTENGFTKNAVFMTAVKGFTAQAPSVLKLFFFVTDGIAKKAPRHSA